MSEIEVNKILLKKTSGLISSIESMSEKEKSKLPSEDYGKNINAILEKARETNPDIKDFIPSNVSFSDYELLGLMTSTSWIEIHAKLKQLSELLEDY
ncbi:MAG: hypothetical protein JJ958_06215 [Balneola sp.]|nr:hypothetical protein [Balneola sp.]